MGYKLKCTRYVWVSVSYSDVLKDCFDVGDAQWYGGGELFNQSWPIQIDSRSETAYVVRDVLQNPEHYYGGVIDSFWVSSKGLVIKVDDDIPLFVSLNQTNDKKLCFASKNRSPYVNRKNLPPEMQYTVCTGRNLLTVYKEAIKLYFKRPTSSPDAEMFKYPIWNTWAKYHSDINQSVVLDFAHNIDINGFPKSLLQIDDKWESCYGDLEFDNGTFPDPKGMITQLNSMGYRVNLWVHPFVNEECKMYEEAVKNGYLVKKFDGSIANAMWWNGNHSGVIDITNPAAANWWKRRLQRLQIEYGVNSFKFDAGETNWLPNNIAYFAASDKQVPNIYPTKYVQFANEFGGTAEVRTGYKNQNSSIFVRLLDRDSTWNNSMGLQTMIPAMLIFGVLGYPYIIPDMIGGNGFFNFPSRELYVRWMQVNALFPVMQFSISPYQYDEEVVDIAKKMIQIHEDHSRLFIQLAEEASKTGWPIIRPLWWLAPTDFFAQVVSTEFLIGKSVLVAPVLEEGATSRDIYLPAGNWYDNLKHNNISGPVWLHQYDVQLHELPYFTVLYTSRHSNEEL